MVREVDRGSSQARRASGWDRVAAASIREHLVTGLAQDIGRASAIDLFVSSETGPELAKAGDLGAAYVNDHEGKIRL